MKRIIFIVFVSMILTSGCLGQSLTPQTTETPAPTIITSAPTMTTAPITSPPRPKDYKEIMDDLEENFPTLASELKELLELKGNLSDSDIEALNDIYYLWKNATNPEVKEAFDLMSKGGIPDPKDFSYSVPKYNTELEVLFWLGEQNEFKPDDTLVLAIAMVNGLYVTMGDDEVKKAVKKDTNDLLNFFRETNEWQRENRYFQLEDYPLEAKMSLSWTGGATPAWGVYGLSDKLWSGGYTTKRLDLKAYRWDSVNVTTLARMRMIIEKNDWSSGDVNLVVANLEEYFYLSHIRNYQNTWRSDHWIYSRRDMYDVQIEIGGEKYRSFFLLTPNYQFDFYLRNGYVTGNCADETVFVGAWAKSWGVATTGLISTTTGDEHMYSVYYNPATKSWNAYSKQLTWYLSSSGAKDMIMLRILRPPIQQKGYLHIYDIPPDNFGGGMFTIFMGVYTLDSVREMFTKGVPTSQMKQWLLYFSG